MALSPTDLGDNTGASVSSITLASVSITAGELVMAVVNIMDPFDAATVSGVTLNGVAMTQVIAKKGASGGSQWGHTSTWRITAGSTGTYDIVATFTDTATTCQITGRKYTGFNAATPIGDTDSIDANASGTISLTLTTAAGDEVLDGKAAENYGNDESPNGGQTALYDATEFGVSYKSAAGASTTVGWSNITNAGYVYTAVVIQADTGGGGAGDSLLRPPMVKLQPMVAQ